MVSCPMCGDEKASMAALEKGFNVTPEDIRGIIADFHSEMQKGLSGRKSSLKMIPAFVDRPRGSETGRFIALDLGGTNFRILLVDLDGNGRSSVLAASRHVVGKAYMTATADALFDFLAGRIDQFLADNRIDPSARYFLGFTFSFPVEQTGVASGSLIHWTKGFTAEGVAGKDIVALLTRALDRRGLTGIRVAALANDTVGTLVAKSYRDRTCDMGVILGTGTNACYVEKVANISKWKERPAGGNMIINMEWGNFSRLRRNRYDRAVDQESPNPGSQYLEKMVSGMYLSEISRHVLNELIDADILFRGTDAGTRFIERGSFQTEEMSLVQSDESEPLAAVDTFLKTRGVQGATCLDRRLLKRVCTQVSARAAMISAAAVAGVLTWMDPDLSACHTVGIDGALFEKYPGFGDTMSAVYRNLFGEKAGRIKMELSKDGSGIGAAIIAAVATSSRPWTKKTLAIKRRSSSCG